MSYQISDFDELQIYITDGWREWYVPKFRIYMIIDEPVCYMYWTDTEKGSSGLTRMIPLDYNDVAFGYTYPSSASEVALVIEAYQLSAWTASGDVVGTGASVDGNFPMYSGTTGKIIQDSGYSPNSFLTSPQILARTLGS